MIDPEAGLGPLEWILREKMRCVIRIRVLDEFTNDKRLIERFPFILERRHQAFWIDGCGEDQC